MPIPSGGLVTKLDFSDPSCYPGSGTVVYDLVGNNDFDVLNSPTFVSDGQKSYFQFAANTNKLQTATPVDVTSQTVFTFSVWAMSTGGSSAIQVVFGSGQNNPSGGVPHVVLNVAGSNVVSSTYGYGVGTAVGTAINQNQWYLLTMTCDGTTNKIYINGTLAGSGPRGTGSIFNDPTNFVIGQYNDSDFSVPWIGRVGAYYYYNIAISATDVQNLYNSTYLRFSENLVAEYDFQNPLSYPGSGSTVYDLSGIGNTLAITSGGAFVSGYPSYINLNQNTAIYKSPALGGIASTNIYTLNAWYWLPSSSVNGVNYQVGKDLPNNAAQIGSGFGLGPLFASGGFGLGVLPYTGAVSQGWNFLSYVSTGSSTTAYLNGVSVGTDSNVPSLTSDTGICIGTALNNSSPPTPRLDLCGTGRIGYYSIYASALDPADLLNIYNQTAPLYDGIVAKYDLNDPLSYSGTGNTLYDLSENNYDITLSNTTYTSTANYNSLIFLKGSSSKGTYVGDIGLGTTTPIFTYAMWVKPTDLVSGVNYGWFLSYGKELFANGGAPGLFGEYAGANNYSFSFGSGKGLINSGQSFTLNQWYFLTATCDGTDIKLYLNGSYLGTTTLSPGAINAPQELAINYLTQTSVGYISFELNYLEIYNKALSAGEITTIYNNTVSRFAPSPPAYQGRVGGRQFAQGFNG